MMKFFYFICGAFLLIVMGCSSNSVSSAKEFSAWVNNEKNGCKISKAVNGMVMEVKYLPPSFIALKELELGGNVSLKYDSLLNIYAHSTTFLISFKPKDEEKGQDIMYTGISSYKEYVERSLNLNFDLETKIKLSTEKSEYTPVLSSLENTYGLSKGRTVYMVFSDKEKKDELSKASYYDLTYIDDIYNLGILHFIFDYKSIRKNLPQLNIHHS